MDYTKGNYEFNVELVQPTENKISASSGLISSKGVSFTALRASSHYDVSTPLHDLKDCDTINVAAAIALYAQSKDGLSDKEVLNKVQTATIGDLAKYVDDVGPSLGLKSTATFETPEVAKEKLDVIQKAKSDSRQYDKTLVAGAMELATANEYTSFEKVPVVSDNIKTLRNKMSEENVPNEYIGNVQKYIHREAEDRGISKAVEQVEAKVRNANKQGISQKVSTNTAESSLDR